MIDIKLASDRICFIKRIMDSLLLCNIPGVTLSKNMARIPAVSMHVPRIIVKISSASLDPVKHTASYITIVFYFYSCQE